VQPLVFLSNPNLDVQLKGNARTQIITRDGFRRAMTHGDFDGAPSWFKDRPLNTPMAAATLRALKNAGFKASAAARKVNSLILTDLLEDGAHFQDHLGVHESLGHHRRVRSFLVPPGTTAERRDQLLRAARREAQHLTALSAHPHVLQFHDFVMDGPLGGPSVVLEHFEDATPLDAFLRSHPKLSFNERIALIQQLAEALEFCHRKEIFHRALNPRAILVRQRAGEQPDLRLYNFQLAATDEITGTSHLTAFSPDQAAVYIAPEVLQDPSHANAAADVFSLGAIAYLILTDSMPGTTLPERAKLLEAGHLSIAAARDGLAGGATDRRLPGDDEGRLRSLDDVVALATETNPHARADSAIEWLNLLLGAATANTKEPEQPFVDPLAARPGDRLAPDLEVVDILGSGSTARVLRVRSNDTEYALKVALSSDLDDRVRQEGALLAGLHKGERIDRIAVLVRELTLTDRVALLMTDAGESLGSLLAREGPPSGDFARRWGEDLLRALEALEERGVQHRDIKPANLGVLPSSAKKKRSLMLFDFSLAGVATTAITTGTPVYRDPFLELRGHWDAAADRWSAAMTLHELVTGIRPGWGEGNEPAASSTGEIRIAAERFAAQFRSKLLPFFRRALARDVKQRFDSAETMRLDWLGCFASAAEEEDVPTAPAKTGPRTFPPGYLVADKPIAALELSNRAKNALDRAGMITLGELLAMPRNRLSTTRGIGRSTHQEIFAFVEDALRALGGALPVADEPVFFTGPSLTSLPVAQVPGLGDEAAAILEDAGLATTTAVAAAPAAQVTRLLHDDTAALAALRTHFIDAAAKAAGAPTTGSVEAWVDALFAAKRKRSKYLTTAAQLFGLEDVPGLDPGAGHVTGSALAKALKVTPPAVHIALSRAREEWQKHPQIGELALATSTALSRLCGVAPLARVAEALRSVLPHSQAGAGGANDGQTRDRAAEALVRVVAEIDEGITSGRIARLLWLAGDPEGIPLARRLGDAADELAAREPLASTDEARTKLMDLVAGTPLSQLPHDRLVSLAAEASTEAARSARLELYPRGMAAVRALALSAGALAPAQATPEAIRRLVTTRYPEAAPLPEGPALHPLMREIGLEWRPEVAAYQRPGAVPATSQHTAVEPRRSTTHTTHRPPPSPASQEDREFNDKIRIAVERGDFRVLDVTSGYDEPAARELVRRVKAAPISIEARVLAEIDRLMKEGEVDPEVVIDADRRGPAAGDDWEELRGLVKEAAGNALADLVPPGSRTPIVLLHPGILARYGLVDVLARLVESAQRDDAPAVFLINPTEDAAAPAVIDGGTRPALQVPVISPAQRLRVPTAWAVNAARGGVA
jgi:serine/threonine protein kinase